MLPQIIIAVQHDEERRWGDEARYESDLLRLKTPFGEDSAELLALIAEGFPINPVFEPAITQTMELAVEKAKSL